MVGRAGVAGGTMVGIDTMGVYRGGVRIVIGGCGMGVASMTTVLLLEYGDFGTC